MTTGSPFLYFVNCEKDSLSFGDAEELCEKIRNDYDFRLKVQNFVYIAKIFWLESFIQI